SFGGAGTSIWFPLIRLSSRRRYHDENQHRAVDYPGIAGWAVPARGRHEAGPAGGSDAAGRDGSAWVASPIHRRCGGLRVGRSDPAVGAAHPAGTHAAGRRRPRDHHARRDGHHGARRAGRGRAVSGGGGHVVRGRCLPAIFATLRCMRTLLAAVLLATAVSPALAQQRGVFIGVDDDPVLGSPDVKVLVIEFGDYQCPTCRMFWKDVEPRLKKDYIDTGKVKLAFRDFPLNQHPEAVLAAMAVNCARDQNKYWEY